MIEQLIPTKAVVTCTGGVECEATPQVVEHRTGSDRNTLLALAEGSGL